MANHIPMTDRDGNILPPTPLNMSKRTLPEVPDVLLGYTYFLNTNHSSHITIGYDHEDFKMKIILYKNNVFQEMRWDDWMLIFMNKMTIEHHFENGYGVEFIELPKVNEQCALKLSNRNNEKCLICVQNGKKLFWTKTNGKSLTI